MRVGSLFAGIGGFDLGLERAGMVTAWQVENEPWCQSILNKHWPDAPCYGDIREVKGSEVEPVEVLCGGFPCQDISNAGKREGIEGARSSLWKEYARLVGELRPRYVIVENVSVLRKRGLDVVLGDLSALGYDAEWDCLRASDFGAPHRRDRLWLVGYPQCDDGGQGGSGRPDSAGARQPVAEQALRAPRVFSYAGGEGLEGRRDEGPTPDGAGTARAPWLVEPDVGRVAHGVPGWVDRIRGLGNALVPQIAEWIGRRIIAHEHGG